MAFTITPIQRISVIEGKSSMKRLLLASAAACLLAAQSVNAKGCLEDAALGGVAGHMAHHTFLGIFGGCAGGMYVHHLYSKWKKEHPDGTMNDFVSENKDHLPAGWAERLSTVATVISKHNDWVHSWSIPNECLQFDVNAFPSILSTCYRYRLLLRYRRCRVLACFRCCLANRGPHTGPGSGRI